MNNAVIACTDLAKSYNDGAAEVNVLRKINLEIKPAELVAIIGSSGSGKSTLLHLLGGLDKPTSGRIHVAGKLLAELSEKQKCNLRNHYLGFVYQFHHLLPEFTALENVSMPLLIRGEKIEIIKSKAESLLESVGLKNRMLHKIGELSGGERQRVAIARALVASPLCVLADEPTGNLDPRNAEKVLELFLDLQKTHQTSVMMATHDMNIAKHAQRILSLEDGQLRKISYE
ncbi:MAG TPA: lipoprotein-releasing ABC transporter ATP-binding protein LolD [Gammaproteobacteria bacterium]|nr:lipoprotein-releasing ABC transporter ATP-binding protein LolD [Gammaproteobacteria bacterium]